MAPAIVRSGRPRRPGTGPAGPRGDAGAGKAATMMALLRKVREHVERNFEDVGERFPDEVRRMHRQEAERRDVYGKATLEEAQDLLEEGIPVRPLPELPKLDGWTAAAAILEAAKPADDASGIVTHRANRQSWPRDSMCVGGRVTLQSRRQQGRDDPARPRVERPTCYLPRSRSSSTSRHLDCPVVPQSSPFFFGPTSPMSWRWHS